MNDEINKTQQIMFDKIIANLILILK